jgi:hypothetical protein
MAYGAIHVPKNRNKNSDNNTAQKSLLELQQEWAKYWGIQPHVAIERDLLEKSIEFKKHEALSGGLNAEQQKCLDGLIASYKRNPKFFSDSLSTLRPGLRLIKIYNGEHHSVMVLTNGFEYREKIYSSLSEVATVIAGTRWNGWVFFGLKKQKRKL